MYLDVAKIRFASNIDSENIPTDFFIKKVTSQNSSQFEEIAPSREIVDHLSEYLENRKASVKDKLASFGSTLTETAWDTLSPDRPVSLFSDLFINSEPAFVYNGEKSSEKILMFLRTGTGVRRRDPLAPTSGDSNENYLLLVSKSSADSASFIDFLQNEVDEISEIVTDFVTLEEFKKGPDIVEDFLSNHEEIESYELLDAKGDFEEEVQAEVAAKVGPCIGNVRVEYNSGNDEYDVVALPFGNFGSKFAIEVKDFQEVRDRVDQDEHESELSADNLQSRLINEPKISADRLGLNLIMIVNDIPEETYQNLVLQASPIGVNLLNDENYQDELNEHLVINTCASLSG